MIFPLALTDARIAPTTNSVRKKTYIDEGYSMIRTEAPKDLAGRGWVNFARTTPELPVMWSGICVSAEGS